MSKQPPSAVRQPSVKLLPEEAIEPVAERPTVPEEHLPILFRFIDRWLQHEEAERAAQRQEEAA